jgi:hypothetical protein
MKPIPDAALRTDVSRVVGIGLKLSSELFDHNAQVLDIASSIPLPYTLSEALMSQWLAGVPDQVLQDQEFLGSQMDNPAAGPLDLVGP